MSTLQSKIDKNPKERNSIVADAWVKVGKKPKTPVKDGLEIEIVGIERLEKGVAVFARAWTDRRLEIKKQIPSGLKRKNGQDIMTEVHSHWVEPGQIGFGKDGTVDIERFRFFGDLPFTIPDGTKSEKVRTRPDGTEETVLEDNFKEDVEATIYDQLAHTISVKKQKFSEGKIKVGKVGQTTSTFYPDADPESDTVDGYVGRGSVNELFSDIRGGAGNQSSDTGTYTSLILSASATSNQFDFLRRYIVLFDTSTIGTDEIDSATLSLMSNDAGAGVTVTGLGSFEVDIVSSSPASDTALVDADYSQLGTTVFASIASGSIAADNNYNDFTLNASGEANIDKTGISKFGARLNWDTDNSFGGSWASGANSGFYFDNADRAGTSEDPKLVVEHSEAGGGVIPTLLTLGVG